MVIIFYYKLVILILRVLTRFSFLEEMKLLLRFQDLIQLVRINLLDLFNFLLG